MLINGFEPSIQNILLTLNNDRQMVMICSIWSDIVRCFAQKYMANPIKVFVDTSNPVHPDRTEHKITDRHARAIRSVCKMQRLNG